MKPSTFDDLFREAERHDDYWVARLVDDFNEFLVRRMEEQGISRAQLARRLGTSQAYVTKVLRGNVNFTLTTLVKLARAVGAQVGLELREPVNRSSEKAEPSSRHVGRRGTKAPEAESRSPQPPAAARP